MKRFRTATSNVAWMRAITAGTGLAGLVVAGVVALSSGPAVAGIAAPGSSPTLANPTLATPQLQIKTGRTTTAPTNGVERMAIRPTRQTLGYYHTCPPGYQLPGGRGREGYLSQPQPVRCVR